MRSKFCEDFILKLRMEYVALENITGILENTTDIIVMIIKYSKTRSKEVEEEMALDIFFKGMPLGKSTKEPHVNNVAIRAFHTLTVVDYNYKNGIVPRTVLETDV